MEIKLKISDVVMINDYLNARHQELYTKAKKIQATLKRKFKNNFEKIMLYYGDPDKRGQFDIVQNLWIDLINSCKNGEILLTFS